MRQLQGAARRLTANLIPHAGLVPPGEPIVYLDIDSKVKQVYGPGRQGASLAYTKERGVTASTPSSRPVIVARRLRRGSAGSGKGADSPIAEAIHAVREARVTAVIVLRADSAFFSAKTVEAIRAGGDVFSITVGNTQRIRTAISRIPEPARRPIKYRDAVWDQHDQANAARLTFPPSPTTSPAPPVPSPTGSTRRPPEQPFAAT